MKALLVSSHKLGQVSRADISPPLNLLYISSVLQSVGVSSQLLDLNLVPTSSEARGDGERLEAVRSQLSAYQPDVVGISCLTTSHFPFMRRVASLAKKTLPEIKIILGGVHATLFSREILENCQDFDFIILGEGEQQTTELVKALRSGNNEDLSHIQALGWKTPAGKVMINPRKHYIANLDSIPMAAWDTVDFNLYYRDHSNWYNPKNHDIKISIPILTTRSCPYECNFCSAHKTMGKGFRCRTPLNVVDEIEYHVNTFGHRYFGIADDNFTLKKSHVIEVCDLIKQRNLDIQFESFNGYNLASLDGEVIHALASAGCIYAILPIEHGCDKMRNDIIGKKLSRKKIFEVMDLYRKYNIQTRAMFIMGFPEDTNDTLEETRKMLMELKPDMADVFTLIPFPGTKVFDQALRDNLFTFDLDHSGLWTGELPLNTKGDDIYIKPYSMIISDLCSWREKFNQISADLLARRNVSE